ncbi:hypothetical protein IC617_06280 [Neiella sp. HB171785]|uniref:Sialate O-acetylesterase domain-containing protein n=1 Tax=Neiella litorisoli TaxID=2771431 RepID=A0A8J6QQ13_9GAMM|nr:sialate O-acetylesterase [Neiella litorisoli]MBD1389031.1 hypothetical protein [Neiella litorisoli]
MRFRNWALAILMVNVMISCSNKSDSISPVTLDNRFADHMVLQRLQPIPLSGTADPASEINISLAGHSALTVADDNGHWHAQLPAMPAGGPYQLTIVADRRISLKDIYLGDVWLASGQSNMEWKVANDINNMAAEIADSNYPLIRYAEVENSYSEVPQSELKRRLSWQVASPSKVANFSAVAWFFAKHLQHNEQVAVGIVDSTWGGTPAEAWAPAPALLPLPAYQAQASDIISQPQQWRQRIEQNEAAHQHKWQIINNTSADEAYGVHRSDYDDQAWQRIDLPTPEPLADVVWLRKRFELANANDDVVIEFGTVIQNAHVYLNGQLIHQKDWSSTLDRLPLDNDLLRAGDNLLALRITNDWDNKVFVGLPGRVQLHINDHASEFGQGWAFNNRIAPPLPMPEYIHWRPSMLYNSMIEPLTTMPIKGVIWYQGESNADQAEHYQDLFAQLIGSWRDAWGNAQLPFIFTQLANFMTPVTLPSESDWATLREAQRHTLQIAKTGMAVTIDIGDADDIHPRNKQDVGYRLWLAANRVVYQHQPILDSPQPVSAEIQAGEILVRFNQTAAGLKLTNEQPLAGFAVKDKHLGWQWISGRVEGDKVILQLPATVNQPQALRYAWADNPKVNLVNSANLPVTPFQWQFDR